MAIDGGRIALAVMDGEVVVELARLAAGRGCVFLLPWCDGAARVAGRRLFASDDCAGRHFGVFAIKSRCTVWSAQETSPITQSH